MQFLAALGCALDLRYLGSGAALGNLVQGLAIPHQRALAGWLPRAIILAGWLTLCLSVIAPAAVVAHLPHLRKGTPMVHNFRQTAAKGIILQLLALALLHPTILPFSYAPLGHL